MVKGFEELYNSKVIERFVGKLELGENDCINWTGNLNPEWLFSLHTYSGTSTISVKINKPFNVTISNINSVKINITDNNRYVYGLLDQTTTNFSEDEKRHSVIKRRAKLSAKGKSSYGPQR